MALQTFQAVPSAAVASGGTIAFTLGTLQNLGLFKLLGGHKLYVRGHQYQYEFPKDFTISFSGVTATVTYNGTTPIPANTVVTLQLDTAGDLDGKQGYLLGSGTGIKNVLGAVRAVEAPIMRILFGAVLAASATKILATTARAGTVKNTYATPVTLDVPRGVTVKSSTTDTTQTITVYGTDEYGVAMSENLALNGTTAVNGKKAFATVTADKNDIALAGTLSIGTQAGVLGLPFFLAGGTGAGAGYTVGESQDGAKPTAGTFVGGDLTKASATTGDVRGTWTPNAAPDAAKIFEVLMPVADTSFLGNPQFTS